MPGTFVVTLNGQERVEESAVSHVIVRSLHEPLSGILVKPGQSPHQQEIGNQIGDGPTALNRCIIST